MKIKIWPLDGSKITFDNVPEEMKPKYLDALQDDSAAVIFEDAGSTIWFPKQQIIRVEFTRTQE